MTELTYSTREAALMAGVTYRMLDYWLRTGAVRPEGMDATPGSGRRRRWLSADVDRLIAVVEWLRLAEAIHEQFRDGTLWNDPSGAGAVPAPAPAPPLERNTQ